MNLRSLKYYWRINLAVLLGTALAVAILTGALIVGDSVRGSLKKLALDRLGTIQYALTPNRFFSDDLLSRLRTATASSGRYNQASGVIMLRGTAIHAGNRSRATEVNVIGIDSSFLALYGHESLGLSIKKSRRHIFAPVVLNNSLALSLNADSKDQILLNFEQVSAVHRESLFGRKNTADVVRTLRVQVDSVVADRGLGAFHLQPSQKTVYNVFVDLQVLRRRLNLAGQINAVLIPHADTHRQSDLNADLREVLDLEDFSIKLIAANDYFTVESSEFVINPTLEGYIQKTKDKLGLRTFPIYTYLANQISFDGKTVPYSTISAIDLGSADLFGGLSVPGSNSVDDLDHGEIVLSSWAFEDLGARPGDSVSVSYYRVGDREQLVSLNRKFVVKHIAEMSGLAIDNTLTPQYPGIHEADNISTWDPPFPVDLKMIRARDERYWDLYKAAPKAFVSLSDSKKLWSNRFGNYTSIRIEPGTGMSVEETASRFDSLLHETIDPRYNRHDIPIHSRSASGGLGGCNRVQFSLYRFQLFLDRFGRVADFPSFQTWNRATFTGNRHSAGTGLYRAQNTTLILPGVHGYCMWRNYSRHGWSNHVCLGPACRSEDNLG